MSGALRELTTTEIKVRDFIKETLKAELSPEHRAQLYDILGQCPLKEAFNKMHRVAHSLTHVLVLVSKQIDIEWFLTHHDPKVRSLGIKLQNHSIIDDVVLAFNDE